MEQYEKLYIEESGDEKPEAENYSSHDEYRLSQIRWYKRFSLWLCKRLEKVEKENDSMGKLQLEIADWQDKTFPEANALSKMSHLAKEVIELNKALLHDTEMIHKEDLIADELADCQHLLFGIASKCGISQYGITRNKFEINKKRIWGKPNSNGVVEHIK